MIPSSVIPTSPQRRAAICLIALLLSFLNAPVFAAMEHQGVVHFGGLPVPGATITATKGNKRAVAVTDQDGVYRFMDLEDGVWTFQVEMQGFATQTQMVTVANGMPGPTWELKLLPFEEITKGLPLTQIENGPPANATSGNANAAASGNSNTQTPAASNAKQAGGFQRAAANATSNAPPPAAPVDTNAGPNDNSSDLAERAASGLLINGSVNNGAASPFAQIAAFGNNRRGPGSLYNGGIAAIFDTSAWDAAPYSLTSLSAPKPSYNDVQLAGQFGGPLGIPHHLISASNFFVNFAHLANDSSSTLAGRVPTQLEREGDFSQTLNTAGQSVQLFNPTTGMPFAGETVPVNAQAAALLNEYPLPNVTGNALYNYQAVVSDSNRQDAVQARATKNAGPNQVFGNFALLRSSTDATSLFGFQDSTTANGLDSAINWSHRLNRGFTSAGAQFLTLNFKFEYSRQSIGVTPFFANRANISGNAGIAGNDQSPQNWGPPGLIFSSGVAGFAEPEYQRDTNQTLAFSYSSLWSRGRHNISFGADVRRQDFDLFSQQDARGTFGFTGAATQQYVSGLPVAGTGSDLADFLLGVPDTVAINFGNAQKNLRGWMDDAYITDDWRVNSGITLNIGMRWEFSSPVTETDNRLANLDISPNFAAATPITAGSATGSVTGQGYPDSLLRPDYRGIEPRFGFAWRPRPASPLVIRGGYGVYDNTGVYEPIAMQLAQQPPFTKTLSIQNSVANPLTLATAFNAVPANSTNTFAVNPNFRVGYVQVWTLSVQKDLPGSLTMTATYLGDKGTRLMQEFLPNTYPLGTANPCPACPAGFVYLDSNGNSTRQAGTIQVRRRLRNGFTASLQYTYAHAIDDASSFSGLGLGISAATGSTATLGNTASNATATTVSTAAPSAPSIAQNWLNLAAERGPSTFDQRHSLNFQMQYTSGEGLHGGALLSGWRGTVFKEWTFTTLLTAGSGFPLTPVYLTNVQGTGITGTIRPNYTGANIYNAPPGLFLNPAAFTAPATGQWGDAGRGSIRGPMQFGLNASIARTFRLDSRLSATWTMTAANMLNTVTYTSWNTIVSSPLFGLPNQANTMRKLLTSIRVTF